MTDTLLSELKQMGAEMAVNQYVPEQWHWLDATDGEDFTCGARGMWGNAAGGKAIKTCAVGGAEAYHDIVAEGGRGTRADVHRAIDAMILDVQPRGKREQNLQRAIYRVALGRLGATDDVVTSKPSLPPGAGEYYTPEHRFATPTFAACAVTPSGDLEALATKLVRYIRDHARKPFGPRGQAIMHDTLRRVLALANEELGR